MLLTVWYGNTTQDERYRLSRVVQTAGRIISWDLPSLDEIYSMQNRQWIEQEGLLLIPGDSAHTAHSQLEFLPPGRRIRTAQKAD